MLLRSLVLLMALVVQFAPIPVRADVPELIEDRTAETIPANRKEPFFLYLSYGNPSNNVKYDQAIFTLSVDKPSSVNFVSNNLFEVVRSDESSTSCSDNTLGTEYMITYDLVKEGTLVYGPRTAAEVAQSSGAKVGVLAPKQTGCLKIGLKLMPSASAGETVTVTFAQDYINDNAEKIKIPEIPKKTILLGIGSASGCANGQVAAGSRCVPECSKDTYLNSAGECVLKQMVCPTGKEFLAENCVDVCPAGTVRNTFGDCKQASMDYSQTVSAIVALLLLLLLTISLFIISASIIRRIRKRS